MRVSESMLDVCMFGCMHSVSSMQRQFEYSGFIPWDVDALGHIRTILLNLFTDVATLTEARMIRSVYFQVCPLLWRALRPPQLCVAFGIE